MTASAPSAIALETSPPLRIPPSAITWQYSPVSSMCVERACATSRLAVDLLHLARGLLLGQARDPLELLVGVLVAREDALEVEHGEPAETADDPGRRGRDDAVHGRRQQRELELVRAELPGDVDVVG